MVKKIKEQKKENESKEIKNKDKKFIKKEKKDLPFNKSKNKIKTIKYEKNEKKKEKFKEKKEKKKEKEKEKEEEQEEDEFKEKESNENEEDDMEKEENDELEKKEINENEEEDMEEEEEDSELKKIEDIENEELEEDSEEEESEEEEKEEKEEDEKKEKNNNKKDKEKEEKHEDIKLLSNPITEHYYTFQYPKDLFTLLYTSLIFKWIDTTKLLILCDTPKEGYKIDIFLREFRFNSIYLDKEMPLNTNTHFYNQYLKNNYQICIVNLEYSDKSKNYAKEIIENTKIPITIIYFDCFSLELLEYHSFHPNTRAIYHFISNKDSFLDNYENLNEDIIFNEFEFDREQMEHLRYRAEDTLNGIRKSDIKKEKMRKINIELLHSKNMEKFFKENPKEKENVIRTIQENTIKNFRPSVSFLPSYLIHNENNVIADAIKKEYKSKPVKSNNRRKNKKKKMEQYFEALDKGDGSQNLIKF